MSLNLNNKKSVASTTTTVVCGLALVASTLAGNAWARGGSGFGGRSSSGMSRYSGPQSNFVRTTPNYTQNFNSVNRVNQFNNFKVNSPNNFTKMNSVNNFTKANSLNKFNFNKNLSLKNGLGNNKQFQKFAKNKGKGPSWKKYWGWGFGWWGGDFGWGWDCWDSPYCCGWCEYEPIPVAAYYNPYCECAGTMVDGIDYSVPIANLPTTTVDGGDADLFATAREAFQQGDLDAALKAISAAALQSPHNQDIHQFHSLVLFAKQEYCKSATVAHAVLEEGPGWTWSTLQTFYASPDVYTQELRQLEQYVREHSSDANVRFLLGYHYLMLNHVEVAQRQFARVAEVEPKDKLSANILGGLKSDVAEKTETAKTQTAKVQTANMQTIQQVAKTESTQAASNEVASTKTASTKTTATKPVVPKGKTETDTDDEDEEDSTITKSVPAIPATTQVAAVSDAPAPKGTDLTGTFKANPAKGVQIELALRSDKTFAWNFAANGKSKSFSGKYMLADNSLVLTREDGESMDGTLERNGNGFKFRMKDAETNDPGLSFSR
jgi:hypothetical protein